MELEMQVISRETLKPSSPTPSHLKTFSLSFLDQIFQMIQIPILLFYITTTNRTSSSPLDISTLKTTLAQTLSKFYPLAGRFIDDSNISCNDEGIPFVETRVNSLLTELLTSTNKIDLLHKFLPPLDLSVLLSFQINVFECGGVVIGCYAQHKLLDTASFSTFFQYWAALASKRYKDVVDPNFDAIVKAFPPCPELDRTPPVSDLSTRPFATSHCIVRSFRVSKVAISALKGKATSEAVTSPTSFEAVAGFIWENLVSAKCSPHASIPEATTLLIITNMRPRINPPLPRESIGNGVSMVKATATRRLATLKHLVGEIHGAISNAKLKFEKFQGENGIEEVCKDQKALMPNTLFEEHPCVYSLSSWCKLGLSEADFGLGKPNWIIPTDGKIPPSLRNLLFFTDYSDSSGDGIEVWLFLEENEMRSLESNEQFLDYASLY